MSSSVTSWKRQTSEDFDYSGTWGGVDKQNENKATLTESSAKETLQSSVETKHLISI